MADNFAISSLPRLPKYFNPREVLAFGQPRDFALRPGLTKESRVNVIEEIGSGKPVASYGINIKRVNFLGRERRMFYVFDYVVDPSYRNQKLSEMLNHHFSETIQLEYQSRGEKESPIFFAVSAKGNDLIARRMLEIGLEKRLESSLSSWRVKTAVDLPVLPRGYSVVVKEEGDVSELEKKMESVFSDYEFSLVNYNELLDHCRDYITNSYLLQLKEGDKVFSEASISIWNKDIIHRMRNSEGEEVSHRQLFGCFATGQNQHDRDLAFQYLLRYVHNDQLKKGVDYICVNLTDSDPLAKHFPLLPGIKKQMYNNFIKIRSEEERHLFSENSSKPIFIDPRDFGIVFLNSDG